MADKYVVKQETDVWGNDKTVIKRETTAADVGAAAGTLIGLAIAANRNSKNSAFNSACEFINKALANGDFDAAYGRAKTLSSDGNRDYRAVGLILKGRAARFLEKHDEATGDLSTAIQMLESSSDPDAKTAIGAALFERGCVFLAKGDSPNAIRDFTKVIQFDPTHYGALNGRGTALRKIGNFEQSIRDLSQAIQFEPGESDHYLERGLTFVELKDYQKALDDFAQAASLAPASSAGYRNRGIVFASLGEHDKAISEYSRAIQVNSAYAPNFLERAKSYRVIAKDDEASQDESRAEQINSEESAYSEYLARAKEIYAEGFQQAYKEDDRIPKSPSLAGCVFWPLFILVAPAATCVYTTGDGESAASLFLLGAIVAIIIAITAFSTPRSTAKKAHKYLDMISVEESTYPGFASFFSLFVEATQKSERNELKNKTASLFAEHGLAYQRTLSPSA